MHLRSRKRSPSSPLAQRGLQALGLGTVVFGIGPLIEPRLFCQLFGVPFQTDRSGAAMPIRAVGWRDLVNGLGLLFDRKHRRHWLWLRFAFDAGDVVTTVTSLRPREDLKPLRLTLLAAGATLFDAALLLLTRNADR